MKTTDKYYAELLALLGIKPQVPTCQELIDELGEGTW